MEECDSEARAVDVEEITTVPEETWADHVETGDDREERTDGDGDIEEEREDAE